MATRFCFLDYDRELAIVAEVEQGGKRKLAAVARLVADVDHERAEYAVLVGDHWQSHGLGGLLTDYCLEIAREWQLRRVTAETSPDNTRMLAIFRDRGFDLNYNVSGVVTAQKSI
jgi:acetyltransferase